MQTDGAAPAEPLLFVVRTAASWSLTPVPPTSPEVVDLGTVLAAVAASTLPSSGDAEPWPATAPLDPTTVVGPVWTWVGRVTGDGVCLEDNDGELRVLDGDDLRLLDLLDGPSTVAELVGRCGLADAPVRLGRLLAAGRVREVPDDEVAEPAPAPIAPAAPAVTPTPPRPHDGRIGVHAAWQEAVGPSLSVGMLLAAARQWDGGRLQQQYDIRRPQTASEVLEDLAVAPARSVLLCSNYVWSLDDNLALIDQARARCPDLVVIHGGPSTPKYPGDAERFLHERGTGAEILVRGEGEAVIGPLLDAIAPTAPRLDPEALAAIGGLTFRDPRDGSIVRTGEPERIADLDVLPSPYLSGEFDHIDPAAWHHALSIETNRGCPYGCTFCDWGSATLSRIRKFDLDRVLAELEWAADRGIDGIQICDANFGIMARDVDIARGAADIRRRRGQPSFFAFTPAKNTTKHITKILDAVLDAGFLISTAISLQTTDEGVLAAVARSNIATDGYLALAADLRRRGLPLQGDVLIGLPEQTTATYKADLQFFLDHEIAPRSWSVRALPNAPMNDPAYRARYDIRTGGDQIVTSTSTAGPEDRTRMLALRKTQVIADQFGVLAPVMRFLQWDHGVAMTDLLDHLIEVTTTTPERFPLLTWVLEYFDLHPTVAVGWHHFEAELRRLLTEDYDLDPTASDLDTVLRLQTHLLPAPERHLPATIHLDHDYLAYYRDTTATLHTTGHASTPPRPLADYPPAPFTVTGDHLGLCTGGLLFDGDSRDESMLGQFWINIGNTFELLSPLTRIAPAARVLDHDERHGEHRDGTTTEPDLPERAAVPVALGRR